VLLGEILLRQGRPASAGRIFRDSSGLLAERDILGYRPWALSGLARARARLGQSEESAAALVEAELVHPIARHFDISLYLAHVELERSRARPAEAARAAADGVAGAAAPGLVGDEAIALEESLRLSPSRELAARLGELSAETDSQYVATLADYARALCSRDVDGLLEAGDRVAAMTAWWSAADATAAAVPLLDGASQKRAAKAAALKATTFASKCEGYVPSTPGMVLGPVRLTKREAEIARFAVAGGANREIAERMYLSLRTVENHLHHVYVRLGVTDRAGLAAVSRLTAPVEQLRPRTS
jgi:DNA-binding NarL/FixJ family response regulator